MPWILSCLQLVKISALGDVPAFPNGRDARPCLPEVLPGAHDSGGTSGCRHCVQGTACFAGCWKACFGSNAAHQTRLPLLPPKQLHCHRGITASLLPFLWQRQVWRGHRWTAHGDNAMADGTDLHVQDINTCLPPSLAPSSSLSLPTAPDGFLPSSHLIPPYIYFYSHASLDVLELGNLYFETPLSKGRPLRSCTNHTNVDVALKAFGAVLPKLCYRHSKIDFVRSCPSKTRSSGLPILANLWFYLSARPCYEVWAAAGIPSGFDFQRDVSDNLLV